MPYIKQEYRPQFNIIIQQVRKGNVEEAVNRLTSFLKKLSPHKNVDGYLNYIFTQILKNHSYFLQAELVFIRTMVLEIYASPLSYHNINAFNGLVTSMIDEFEERGWDTLENITFLIRLRLLFRNSYTKYYEEKKREENGDLEEVI